MTFAKKVLPQVVSNNTATYAILDPMADLDNSFDENESIDLASVVAEFPNGDDHPEEDIKIKQLANAFDMVNTNMKVYLRVRPFKGKEEGTIKIESETSILTVAPEQSKRAQYTKTESRNYVSAHQLVILQLKPRILQR